MLNAVRCPYVTYVRNAGRGQLSGELRHNENDVVMIIAGLWRYGDWRHVATGCNALVIRTYRITTYVDAACCYRPISVLCPSVCLTVGRSAMIVSLAKTAEPIEVPFGV